MNPNKVTAQGKNNISSAQQTETSTIGGSLQDRKQNALLEALSERLIKQGKGISSSSSTKLQDSINSAITQAETSGKLGSQALQIEREREVGFEKDRAVAKYTGALEGRTGYATMTYGLKELTETTEKSIRDLDGRYQQAILTNDAATAKSVSDLMVKKLEFQNQQEQNYFNNMISLSGQIQQEEQFFQKQEQDDRQFTMQMAQSNYQFEKNLGIQYKELDLKGQELEIARERNQISWADYNLKKSDLNKEKSRATLAARVFGDMRNEVLQGGKNPGQLDPSGYATWLVENAKSKGQDLDFEEALFYAQSAKSEISTQGLKPPPAPVVQSGFGRDISALGGSISKSGIFDYFTKPAGSAPKRTMDANYWGGGGPKF